MGVYNVFTEAADKKKTHSAVNVSNNTLPACGQPAQDASSQDASSTDVQPAAAQAGACRSDQSGNRAL